MPDKKNKISIIIPALNEEATIAEVIRSVKPFGDEIIVVDGNSKDLTAQTAKSEGAIVVKDNSKGKGDALRVGASNSTGDIIIFIDADGSHNPADIPKIIEALENGADLVIGSRMTGGSDELHGTFSNFMRMTGSGIAVLIINFIYRQTLTDVQNGFRGIKREIFFNIDTRANDFDIEQEITVRCLKRGYKVEEIASHEYARMAGKSNLSVLRKGHKFLLRLIIDFFR
ncbi:glycosyltransferase family 2 protein [bacterium]|nr:glycosyltransferase family 2 protein [bacterium]